MTRLPAYYLVAIFNVALRVYPHVVKILVQHTVFMFWSVFALALDLF